MPRGFPWAHVAGLAPSPTSSLGEIVSDIYVFGLGVLYWIFQNVDSTHVVTV